MRPESANDTNTEETRKIPVQDKAHAPGVGVVKDPRGYLLQALTSGECGRHIDYCPLRVLREIQDIVLLGDMIRGLTLTTATRMLKLHFTCSGGLRDDR